MNKKDIRVSHINDLAVDLGITKTVTENGKQVTYKLLWSPFNHGVESKVDLKTYNGAPINEDYYISLCTKNLECAFHGGILRNQIGSAPRVMLMVH